MIQHAKARVKRMCRWQDLNRVADLPMRGFYRYHERFTMLGDKRALSNGRRGIVALPCMISDVAEAFGNLVY